MTSGHGSLKTESVSAPDKIIGDGLRLQVFLTFLTCLRNGHNLPNESPALTRSGIANAFWKSPKRHSPGRAPMPAWTTSPNRRALDRELCIDTFLRARNFYRRFIGLRWKSSPQQSGSSLKACRRSKRCEPGYCCSLMPSRRSSIIAPALNTLIGDPKKVFAASYAQIHEAIRCPGEARDQERRHTQGP